MADDLTVHLLGSDLPDGEIDFDVLAGLSGALQQLSTRVHRQSTGQTVGRTSTQSTAVGRLRLRRLDGGSTTLVASVGDDQALIAQPAAGRHLARLFEVLTGIGANRPPGWIDHPVAEAAVQVIDALRRASPRCEFWSDRDYRVPVFSTARVDLSVWALPEPPQQVVADSTATGRLEMVDLTNRKFRLRDATGNRVPLLRVAASLEAARLVGETVTATGDGLLDEHGQLSQLEDATITRADAPTPWAALPSLSDVDWDLTPPVGGVGDVTDEEVGEFLQLIRGG